MTVLDGTYALSILTSSSGRSSASVSTKPIRLSTWMPRDTRPNIVCLPSSHCVGAKVTKNWLPFVFAPLLAIDRIPAPVTWQVTSLTNRQQLSINNNDQSTMHLYSAEALRVSKALEGRQSAVTKQESFKITIENVNEQWWISETVG